jgi:hypothetical protein
MERLFYVLVTLGRNYKSKTPLEAKVLDYHILICLSALVVCELYRTMLRGYLNESYNICFLTVVGSLSLTCNVTRLHARAAVRL